LTADGLTRRFVLLRALRWLPVGLVLPFLVITPESRGLSLGEIGAVFAVHSCVAIALEVPSGALADTIGRRRVLLAGALLTAVSLAVFAVADGIAAFMASVALLAAGRALISGALEAWYVDSLRALDPAAPLSHGLSRGTAAEGIAMAFGALAGGALVTLSGYGAAAIAGALAALAYLAAVAALVGEPRGGARASEAHESVAQRTREVFRTARAEAAASVAVRVVFLTGVALGMSFTAVELLWQPRLGDLLDHSNSHGVVFGALAAGSMLAVAAGASASTTLRRRLGLRLGYLLALAFGAVCIALLGAPGSPAAFALVYLLAYLGLGLADPMHFELLNDAVGPTARATLISAESLATQGGALGANLSIGALASTQGPGLAWALAGILLALATAAAAVRLYQVRSRKVTDRAEAV
jgi:MFS family permease